MEPVKRISDNGANAIEGNVEYDIPKLIWNLGMFLSSIIFIPFSTNIEAVVLFLVITYFSLLVGHSAGMHRMMIHRTYQVPKLVERLLIYIGVLVGMAGPFGVIKIHDLRDWAQRQRECHDFFSHTQPYLKDLWWQLTSRFEFTHSPTINIESNLLKDDFYQFLERTWKYHQLLLALILYYIGGWPFVVWGVFVRVSVSVIGHWTITYFCHNPGPGRWYVKGASVQASNIPGLGILTFGECWHNNHHAFPESAHIGLESGQYDPAWRFIQTMKTLGIARNVGLPRRKQLQEDLELAKENRQGQVDLLDR